MMKSLAIFGLALVLTAGIFVTADQVNARTSFADNKADCTPAECDEMMKQHCGDTAMKAHTDAAKSGCGDSAQKAQMDAPKVSDHHAMKASGCCPSEGKKASSSDI